MGITAENICEKYDIMRDEQDENPRAGATKERLGRLSPAFKKTVG